MMPWLRFAGVLLLSLACLTGGPGCSLLSSKGPPRRPAPQQIVRCTRSPVSPFLDGLIAALFVTGVLYVVGNPNGESQSVYARTTGVGLGIGFAGLFTFSMAAGIDRVGRCRELFAARARAQQAEDEEDEDEDDATEGAKAAGKATPASPPEPEPPTMTPQEAPNQ